MKPTTKSTNGTSFHGTTFKASVSDLRKILGDPCYDSNDGSDKINFSWDMETEGGIVFTVYDWKEYRVLEEDEIIEWHVGGFSLSSTEDGLEEIAGALNDLENGILPDYTEKPVKIKSQYGELQLVYFTDEFGDNPDKLWELIMDSEIDSSELKLLNKEGFVYDSEQTDVELDNIDEESGRYNIYYFTRNQNHSK